MYVHVHYPLVPYVREKWEIGAKFNTKQQKMLPNCYQKFQNPNSNWLLTRTPLCSTHGDVDGMVHALYCVHIAIINNFIFICITAINRCIFNYTRYSLARSLEPIRTFMAKCCHFSSVLFPLEPNSMLPQRRKKIIKMDAHTNSRSYCVHHRESSYLFWCNVMFCVNHFVEEFPCNAKL